MSALAAAGRSLRLFDRDTVADRSLPLLVAMTCVVGLLDPVYGPGKEYLNCPNHCEHPNILIKGESWFYLMALALSTLWMAGSQELEPRRTVATSWLAFTLLCTINASVYSVLFLNGYPFETADNFLWTFVLPPLFILQTIFRIRPKEQIWTAIDFISVLQQAVFGIIVSVFAAIFSIEASKHIITATLQNSMGHNTTVNISWQYDTKWPAPTDGTVVTSPMSSINCTGNCTVVEIAPVLTTVLEGRSDLVLYLVTAIFVILPFTVWAVCRYLVRIPSVQNINATSKIIEALRLHAAFITFVVITSPRQIVYPLYNIIFFPNYILAVLNIIFIVQGSLLVFLAPYVFSSNLVLLLWARTWRVLDWPNAWLSDAVPLLMLVLLLVNTKYQEAIRSGSTAAQLISMGVVMQTYALIVEVHFQLYTAVPYPAELPPPSQAGSIWFVGVPLLGCGALLFIKGAIELTYSKEWQKWVTATFDGLQRR